MIHLLVNFFKKKLIIIKNKSIIFRKNSSSMVHAEEPATITGRVGLLKGKQIAPILSPEHVFSLTTPWLREGSF